MVAAGKHKADVKPEVSEHILITPTKRQRTSNVTPATPNPEQSSPEHVKFPFGGPPPSLELSASLNSPIIGDIPLYAFVNVKAMRLFSSVGVLISLQCF
jgi:hypothetical protein